MEPLWISITKTRIVFDFVKVDAEGAEPLIFAGAQDFLCSCTRDSTIFAVEFNPQAIQGLGHDRTQFLDHLLNRDSLFGNSRKKAIYAA